MNEKLKQELYASHQQVALVLAQQMQEMKRPQSLTTRRTDTDTVVRHRAAAILSPVKFWAASLLGDEPNSVAAVEDGLRVTAAKLLAGDISFVSESILGQIAWLSSLTLDLQQKAAQPGISYSAQCRYIELALRAQAAAAKVMLSLSALARPQNMGSVINESA